MKYTHKNIGSGKRMGLTEKGQYKAVINGKRPKSVDSYDDN